MFSTLYGTYLLFEMHFKMSSPVCFNLDQSKILSCGNGLMHQKIENHLLLLYLVPLSIHNNFSKFEVHICSNNNLIFLYSSKQILSFCNNFWLFSFLQYLEVNP